MNSHDKMVELKRIKKEKGIERLTEVLVKNETPMDIKWLVCVFNILCIQMHT